MKLNVRVNIGIQTICDDLCLLKKHADIYVQEFHNLSHE